MTEQLPLTTFFWKKVYEEHGPALLAFINHRVPQRSDAEDLLQDTFVQAIRAGTEIRDLTRIRSYLFRTAHNLLINHIKRPHVIPFSQQFKNGGAQLETINSTEPGPDEFILYGESEKTIERMTSRMSEQHRTAFRLGIVEQRSYREIAGMTGWTATQVKTNVYRARKTAIEYFRRELLERREG